jgi:hypothetical protein
MFWITSTLCGYYTPPVVHFTLSQFQVFHILFLKTNMKLNEEFYLSLSYCYKTPVGRNSGAKGDVHC